MVIYENHMTQLQYVLNKGELESYFPKRVKHCERIRSKSECKKAAESLQKAGELPGLELPLEDGKNFKYEEEDYWPPYCYFQVDHNNVAVYFNGKASGSRACDSGLSQCICREKGK